MNLLQKKNYNIINMSARWGTTRDFFHIDDNLYENKEFNYVFSPVPGRLIDQRLLHRNQQSLRPGRPPRARGGLRRRGRADRRPVR